MPLVVASWFPQSFFYIGFHKVFFILVSTKFFFILGYNINVIYSKTSSEENTVGHSQYSRRNGQKTTNASKLIVLGKLSVESFHLADAD